MVNDTPIASSYLVHRAAKSAGLSRCFTTVRYLKEGVCRARPSEFFLAVSLQFRGSPSLHEAFPASLRYLRSPSFTASRLLWLDTFTVSSSTPPGLDVRRRIGQGLEEGNENELSGKVLDGLDDAVDAWASDQGFQLSSGRCMLSIGELGKGACSWDCE